MPSETESRSKTRFIVVPRTAAGAAALQDLRAAVEGQGPDAATVDTVVGDLERPRRVLINATASAAQALKDRFGDQLIIEPDAATLRPT